MATSPGQTDSNSGNDALIPQPDDVFLRSNPMLATFSPEKSLLNLTFGLVFLRKLIITHGLTFKLSICFVFLVAGPLGTNE